MKNLTFRLLLALLVLTVGVAWANETTSEVAEAAVAVEAVAPEAPQPEAEETDPATLPSFEQEMVESGACCWAECHDEMMSCLDGCGSDFGCRAACRATFNQCKSNC